MTKTENNLQDYYNLLVIRNHLAKISKSDLIKIYQDENFYLSFLDFIGLLSENDSAFLLLDDSFADKILSIIQIHRFDIKDQEVKDYINSIIDYLNGLKTYPENLKNTLKNNYLAYQEEQRKAIFQSNQLLIDSLAYDAIVFSGLVNNEMEKIVYDDHYILSLNFLIATCPELFEKKEIQERAIKRLEELTQHYTVLNPKKKLVKQAKANLEKINKEE